MSFFKERKGKSKERKSNPPAEPVTAEECVQPQPAEPAQSMSVTDSNVGVFNAGEVEAISVAVGSADTGALLDELSALGQAQEATPEAEDPLDLSKLPDVLDRVAAVMLDERLAAEALTQPLHRFFWRMAAAAAGMGLTSLRLTVDAETFRKLRAELGPDGAELASQRWGNNEVRINPPVGTPLGWVSVFGP